MAGKFRQLFQTTEIISALELEDGNISEAAKRLSDLTDVRVSAELLRYWIKTENIEYKVAYKNTMPRILIFDIETSPILAYTWGLWNQNICLDAIVDDWKLLCWSAKWLDDSQVMYDNLMIFGGFNDKTAEEYVVMSLWELLDKADIVVAHNAKRFDVKKMNAKFLQYDLGQPNYYKVVDTLQIAKGNFALTSNKLDFLARIRGFEGKHKTEFSLWTGCMNDNAESWDKMQKYCNQDVTELEKVYKDIRAWDSSHPSVGMYSDADNVVCNVCGHSGLCEGGFYYTGLSKFQVFQCDKCGHQQRDRENLVSKSKERMVNVR